MQDLAKFFADIIEFIVGGILFVGSLLLFVSALSSDSLSSLANGLDGAPAGLSGGYTLAALAVVYAMGIVAEGVSRRAFEWRLGQLTAEQFSGATDPVQERERQRLAAMDASEKLDEAINAQLKRLRIERSLALSSFIATIASALRTEWWCVGFALLTLVAIWLVLERFDRYLKTIKASFAAIAVVDAPKAVG